MLPRRRQDHVGRLSDRRHMTETRVPYNAGKGGGDDYHKKKAAAYRAVQCLYGPSGWGWIMFVIQDGRIVRHKILYDEKAED